MIMVISEVWFYVAKWVRGAQAVPDDAFLNRTGRSTRFLWAVA